MEKKDNQEPVDIDDEITSLFNQLGRYDEKIHSLKVEIDKAQRFIDAIAGNEIDRIGLESSLGMDFSRGELRKHELERNRIFRSIEELQSSRLGEEIPRTESGQYKIPWDTIKLVASRVGDTLDTPE